MSEPFGTSTIAEVLDYMVNLFRNNFTNVSSVYFGDIGVYPPSVFGTVAKSQKPIIVLEPSYDRLVPGERVVNSELRNYGINVIVMVNITPFFQANPPEALGERILVNTMVSVRNFLTQQENVTLNNRVQFSTVGDINWDWTQRKDLSIRGAALQYEATVRVFR